jgi:hypothetical protein
MKKEINKYRVIKIDESQILEDNLTSEQANYLFEFLSFDRGITNLTIEEYFPYSHRLGRDPDLH